MRLQEEVPEHSTPSHSYPNSEADDAECGSEAGEAGEAVDATHAAEGAPTADTPATAPATAPAATATNKAPASAGAADAREAALPLAAQLLSLASAISSGERAVSRRRSFLPWHLHNKEVSSLSRLQWPATSPPSACLRAPPPASHAPCVAHLRIARNLPAKVAPCPHGA